MAQLVALADDDRVIEADVAGEVQHSPRFLLSRPAGDPGNNGAAKHSRSRRQQQIASPHGQSPLSSTRDEYPLTAVWDYSSRSRHFSGSRDV